MMTTTRTQNADTCLTAAGTYYGGTRDSGAYGLMAQVTELFVRGVIKGNAAVHIAIPKDMDKSRINSIRNHTKKAVRILAEAGFEVNDLVIDGCVNALLMVPSVSVVVTGPVCLDSPLPDAVYRARAGQQILMAGYGGLEGMIRLIAEREEELRERFTPAFIARMKAYSSQICGISLANAVLTEGVTQLRQMGEGGVLAALWRLAEETELGISVDLNEIPLLQETIEVCEHFRLNPYQLASAGSFLLLTDDGETLRKVLTSQGFNAVVIGQLTSSNDKILHNGDEIRYLDRPAPDEVWRGIIPG